MDYTLAIYRQEAIDRLSIEATSRKLVQRGYPASLGEMRCRTDFPIRGLLVDRKLGNVLKMDRHRYVKRAYHGMRELSRDERRRIYHTRRVRPASPRYHWVDSLYALSEVAIYAAAVDTLDLESDRVDYDRLFADVRECIDEAHQDGSLTTTILEGLYEYVERDPDLPAALHKLRSSGKRLFLLTNSQWGYTQRMMSHLLDGALDGYPSWRNYFDYVVSASKKPLFFTGSEPFFEVIGEQRRPVETLERGHVYTGGNLEAFHRVLDTSGDRVLYVGDHIYGDVLRAKKDTVWRTAMVIQEMEAELRALETARPELARFDALDRARMEIIDALREHQTRLKRVQRVLDEGGGSAAPEIEAARVRHRHAIDRLRKRLRRIEEEQEGLEERIDSRFHPFWGSPFKAGPEVSSFGDQVEDYACIYTTRVSNFVSYSPMHRFHSPRDRMPHEL